MNIYQKRNLFAFFASIFLLSLPIWLFLFVLYKQDASYKIVLPAISMSKAKRMLKDEECVMVRCKEFDSQPYSLFYFENKGEKEQIFLIGNSPYNELSNVFFAPGENRFLIKGYFDDELTEFLGEKVFYVDSWYFVEPVKRSYGSNNSSDAPRPDARFFSPRDGLDEYDVEHGDYVCLEQLGDIYMTSIEIQYYLQQEGYYLIAPHYKETELKWYLVQNDSKEQAFDESQAVILDGNTPQMVLHHTFFDYTNFFLVRGEMSKNEEGQECILIYKWWVQRRDSSNSFLINSQWGFTQRDIENDIYNLYR